MSSYLRLLSAISAAMNIMMITAGMATYVIVGISPSGVGATLGDGEVGASPFEASERSNQIVNS